LKSMLRFSLSFFLIAVLSISFTENVTAQQQDTENSLLPEIDPQDIEIRSQFRARFPGIRRQPILGFDPNPRVYQIDPNRMPFLETQDQVVAQLPVSELSRPAPPPFNRMNYSDDINLFGRLGFGKFSSPVGQIWGVHRINEKSYIGGDFNFSSSDGHLDNQLSSFRFFDANVDYATKLNSKTELHVTGGGQSDFNYLFNVPSQSETPRKNYSGLNLSADLQSVTNSIEGWKASAEIRSFSADFDRDTGTMSQDEFVYQGSFSKRWAGGNINETFALTAGARGGSFDIVDGDENWATVRAGGEYSRLFNYSTRVTGKAEVYYIDNPEEDKFYIAPSLEVVHSFNDKLKITGKAGAKPYIQTVEQHHEINRFLTADNRFVHTYSIDLSAKASLEYYRGSTIEGGVSYMNADDHPFYFRERILTGGGSAEDQFYRVNFSDATNVKFFAGISHQVIPEKFWFSSQVYVQNPELDNGNRIPFEENWGMNSSVSLQLFKQLTVEGWADYVGDRRRFISDEKVDGFFLVGTSGELEITSNIGAYLKLVNLLDQDYEVWDGYTERPFQVYGGLTVKL